MTRERQDRERRRRFPKMTTHTMSTLTPNTCSHVFTHNTRHTTQAQYTLQYYIHTIHRERERRDRERRDYERRKERERRERERRRRDRSRSHLVSCSVQHTPTNIIPVPTITIQSNSSKFIKPIKLVSKVRHSVWACLVSGPVWSDLSDVCRMFLVYVVCCGTQLTLQIQIALSRP